VLSENDDVFTLGHDIRAYRYECKPGVQLFVKKDIAKTGYRYILFSELMICKFYFKGEQ